jgi:preprotein translocase YajC subunit
VLGNISYLAATGRTSSSSLLPLLIIIVLFGLFYVVIFRPQRARQRRAMQTQNAVVPGQRVRTTAGIYGTIVSADDGDVTLEIAPGVNIKVMRRAILDVVQDGGTGGTTGNPTASTPAGTEPVATPDDRGATES